MNDAEMQRRGFKPVRAVFHPPDENGIIGHAVVKKRQPGGFGGTKYYVLAFIKKGNTLVYGEPLPIPSKRSGRAFVASQPQYMTDGAKLLT